MGREVAGSSPAAVSNMEKRNIMDAQTVRVYHNRIQKRGNMASNKKPANDVAAKPATVTDQILEQVFKRLEECEGLEGVAKRFRAVENPAKADFEDVLFGDDL